MPRPHVLQAALTFLLALGLSACSTTSTLTPERLSRTPTGDAAPTHAPVLTPARTNDLPPPPAVSGAAYIVINPRTGEILLEKNSRQRRPVASTQKILTALVLMERGGLDQSVTVTASDTYCEETKMGIRAGERYNKRKLLEAMVVRSSNDIARCLARTTAGSESAFADLMNQKARQFGMNDSYFQNATGLTAGSQYSTAFDLSILATHALNNPYFQRLCQTSEINFTYADGRTKPITNTNKVLRMSPYCTGMKTGYTEPAGRCLISCGRKGMREIVVVMLGSEVPAVWNDSYALLHWGLGITGS